MGANEIRANLKERTRQFALRIMKVVDSLPHSCAGRVIGTQLLRSATSVEANYRAATRVRSKAEFIAKLGIVLEEADESCYWLELIADGEIVKKSRLGDILVEADELTAIFTAAVKNAKGNKKPEVGSQK